MSPWGALPYSAGLACRILWKRWRVISKVRSWRRHSSCPGVFGITCSVGSQLLWHGHARVLRRDPDLLTAASEDSEPESPAKTILSQDPQKLVKLVNFYRGLKPMNFGGRFAPCLELTNSKWRFAHAAIRSSNVDFANQAPNWEVGWKDTEAHNSLRQKEREKKTKRMLFLAHGIMITLIVILWIHCHYRLHCCNSLVIK